ncbi:hypothetical protein DAH55_12115 [Sphingomonas koreensis]|nr:hypothetical protein DAH56_09280 [Sphingomonas koreensis]RSU68065.1 hypothetical protein DAH55_12115 [Sphingomonas koreensis]
MNWRQKMMHFNYRFGAALAMVSAGPSFALLLFLADMILDPFGIEPSTLWTLFPVVLIAVIPGMAIAFLPILLGGFGMAYFGTRSTSARHPITWAVAGAILGMLMAFLFDDSAQSGLVLPFLLNGAICALIVRYGTRWDDDSV